MGKKTKDYEYGPGETNPETTDAAAEGGADHNEALAQRPGDGTTQAEPGSAEDQAAIEALQRQARTAESVVLTGATTTTTPDSQRGSSSGDQDGPGPLDRQSAEERLEKVRGWAKGRRTQPAMSADYQELDEILNGEIRRP